MKKKWKALLLAALLCSCSAREQTPQWCELSAEDTVLTVRLPMDFANSERWEFEISDPARLELITQEVLGDEPGEPQAGYAGSFMGLPGGIRLTLRRMSGEEVCEVRALELEISEERRIAIKEATVEGG